MTEPTTSYERVRAVFHAACECEPARRQDLLDRECAGDPALRRAVEKLLAHDATPVVDLDAFTDAWAGVFAGASLPDRIGGYRIIERLGEGGMGVVYLAEQQSPRRTVALKLIRPGFLSEDLLRRFELETQVLGRLQHPGIAQIFEAGAADVAGAGRLPFFAMEHVKGETLVAHADAHRLGTRERLELVIAVCHAVEHAHQHGVIHRDLKPSNILVDAEGQPRILDFGIARSIDAEGATVHTRTGELIGTIQYMSPEQVAGEPGRLDLRSDIHALGVICYELIARRLPYDVADRTLIDAARLVREEAPTRLSTVDRSFRGDLETIVAKAMAKEPERRYQSATEFAHDIRRFLDNQPIVARPASTLYQLRKFAKRNSAFVTGLAVAMLALVVGLVAVTFGMVRARDAAESALAMNRFMEEILLSADVDEGGHDIQLVEVLRQASDRASRQFIEHPELEADVRDLLGSSFSLLSLHGEAATHLERAVALRRAALGPAHPRTRSISHRYLHTLSELTRLDEVVALADEILDHTPAREADSKLAIDTRRHRARALGKRREDDEAVAELRLVLDDARRSLGDDDRVTLHAATDLAQLLRNICRRGDSADPQRDLHVALGLLREVLPRSVRVFGENARVTVYVRRNLANVLYDLGRVEEAAATLEETVERAAARYGPDHSITADAIRSLADVRVAQGRFAAAADLHVRCVEAHGRRLGADAVSTISAMGDALGALVMADRAEVGEEYARTVYERLVTMGEHGRSYLAEYRLYRARFLSRLARLDEAESLFDEIAAAGPEALSPEHGWRLDVFLGAHLAARGRFAEAEVRLLAAVDDPGRINPSRLLADLDRRELVALYDAWGKPEQAAEWRASLPDGVKMDEEPADGG